MTTGFVYIATGDERYIREAAASAESLRRHNPGARICLITDNPRPPEFWNDLVPFHDCRRSFRDKLAMHRCPYDAYLYLDTDTYITGELSSVFALLSRFDFCGQQLYEGHDYQIPEVPETFGEFNGGVLGFRRSAATDAFFNEWLRLYDSFAARNTGDNYDYSNVSDQKTLRIALYQSELRVAALPVEFNFTPHFTFPACLAVRIIHGRRDRGSESLASRLNAQLVPRAYVPSLDAVVTNNMSASELWRTLRGVLGQLARLTARRALPLAARNQLRKSRWIGRALLGQHFQARLPVDEEKWRR
jgi:hypothetical protein